MKDKLKEIDVLRERIEVIRRELAAEVLKLPDNPRLQRLSGSPRCFTMSSKDLLGAFNTGVDLRVTNNWTVRFHDFKTQYEEIAAMIGKAGVEHVLPMLRQIIDKGYTKSGGNNGYAEFHPDVRAHLAKLIDAV